MKKLILGEDSDSGTLLSQHFCAEFKIVCTIMSRFQFADVSLDLESANKGAVKTDSMLLLKYGENIFVPENPRTFSR